jgi:hypothetical protein
MANMFWTRSRSGPSFHAQVCGDARPGTSTPVGCLAALALLALMSSAVRAEDCYPHCDYFHDYGPYDLTYIRPGLYAYPVCGPSGDCAPYVVYTYSRYRKRILVRPRPWRAPPRPPE